MVYIEENMKVIRRKIKKDKSLSSNKMKVVVIIILAIILAISAFIGYNFVKQKRLVAKKEEERKIAIQKMINEAKESYNKHVKTVSEKNIYEKKDDKYIKVGCLGKDIEITLEDIDVQAISDKYYKVEGRDYYIDYKDLEKIENISKKSDRYKKYIPFNENILTSNTTSFYKDANCDELLFSINKGYDLPILQKEKDSYGVEILDSLAFVIKETVTEIKENTNTTEKIAKDVPVLLYHFFHPAGSHPEYESWDYVISMRADKLEEQIKYLQDNNFMTLKLDELELFIDGKINIPDNSVVLTIDDGDESIYRIALPIIEKYQVNATVFNICSSYPGAIEKASEFLEIHSHGYDLHKGGCAGGQGGAIKCIDTDKGVEDLKIASQMLNGSTYFAYPFGEYTEHSIDILKEAGYTMAFTTEWGNAKIGMNKYLIPRYYLYNDLTVNSLKNLLK